MNVSSFFDWQYSDEYKKTATDFANALWDILSHAKNYSFAKDPLPIFYLLHAAYCDYDVTVYKDGIYLQGYSSATNLAFPIDDSIRGRILDLFPKDCGTSFGEDWEVLHEFCKILTHSYCDSFGYDFNYLFRGPIYKHVHPFVVEFFIQKFIELYNTNNELSSTYLTKLWDTINNNDETFNCSDYYIPYAGLCSIAIHDIYEKYTTSRINYNCIVDDLVLSIISKVRLCALGHNIEMVKTSSEAALYGLDANKHTPTAMVSVPPLNLKIQKTITNGEVISIDVVEDVITKYLNDSCFQTAYLIFPMSFAVSPAMSDLRKKLVDEKLIKSIDLIPEGSFMTSPTAGILISLDKKNDSDRIKFVFDEGKYSDVSYEEIVNNDFILNPKLYFSNTKTDESKFSYHLNRVIWEPSPIPVEENKQEGTNITSDLIHCLGPIFNRINCALDVNSDNEDFKLVKDNISYMARVIKAFGADFSSYRTNKNEIGVNEFFKEYYSSLLNCNRSIFKIEYNSKLSDDTTFDVDEDVMRIMFDTILDNAYRHGFKKAKNIDARVGISTSCKRVNGKDYVLIEVANNGLPFPHDLTFEKFITRGEFCGENGHTGLGGNHIYNIVKLHDGYLNITKSAKWNIIFDILIPIEYISDEDIDNITDYENEDWCV